MVGSVSGRQPQQLPSSLHCVERLRGGASSSSDEDEATTFGHDGRVDSLLPDFWPRRVHPYEAAGSVFGDDREVLDDRRGAAAHVVSAGVLAREEGRRSRIFDHAVEQEALVRSILSNRNRMQVPQPSVVEGPGEYVQVRFTPLVFGPASGDQEFGSRIFLPPPVTPGNVSSACSSGYPRVVDRGRDGNPDPSATLNGGALSAPSGSSRVIRRQVRHMVIQTDPPPTPRKPCNIKRKRRRRLELEAGLKSSRWFYDPLGTWPGFAGRMPWMHSWSDASVEAHGLGTREVSCGPSLCVDQLCRPGYLWINRSSVQEEPAVCSSAVPPAVRSPVVRSVVVFQLVSDVALVAGGARGSVSCRSTPVKVGPPIVAHALNNVPGGRGYWNKCRDKYSDADRFDEFDDTLVPFYGHRGNGRQLLPPNAPLYNKYVDGKPREDLRDLAKLIPIRARNIRIGKTLIIEGLHVGGVSRFKARTFVQDIGGRKTDTNDSCVSVKDGHHEGRN